MDITLESQGFSVSDAINEYVHTQASGALRYHAGIIHTVDIYLRDVSGHQEPKEYNVVMCLSLRNMPRVVVEGNGCDLYVTSRYVATRAQRAVERALQQAHELGRDSVRPSPLLAMAPLLGEH